MDESPAKSLLEYRVKQLEIVERAMRHEIHELRARELAILRDDYMTRDQLRNTFVTREETQAAAVGRRERWPIVLGGIVVVMQAAGLVLELARPH